MSETQQFSPAARLYVILARSAPVGVIFRRGPSKRVRLIKWRTDSDEFTPGQWFHGRIYEKRCDLSPDGSLLVYFAARHIPSGYAWTAISRPPYLTALSLWHKLDSWWGGGLFENDRTVWLNLRPDEIEDGAREAPPPDLRILPNPGAYGEDYPIESRRWLRDGWVCVQEMNTRLEKATRNPDLGIVTLQEGVWHRRDPSADLVLERRHAMRGFKESRQFRVLNASAEPIYTPAAASWADWDHRGRLVFASAGKLFGASFDDVSHRVEREIADFNAMTPEPIESPDWAKIW